MLYRATELLVETRCIMAGLGYLDRLDYVAIMSSEVVYALA